MSDKKPNFGLREKINQTRPILPRKPEQPKSYLQRRDETARSSQLKKVKLIYNGGYSTSDAILRSISESGAKIQTDDALHLPDTFTMKTLDGKLDKICNRVWRKDNAIGVTFTE